MNEQSNTELSVQTATLSVSELFIKTREQQGYSLEYVANHLRVSKSYIEAIESNNISGFPARVYILGFVRSYAIFLHLNPQECCERFKKEVLSEQISEPTLNFPTMLTVDSSPSQKILKISLGVLAIVLAAGIFIWQWQSRVTDDVLLDKNRDTSMTSDEPLPQAPQKILSQETIKDDKSQKDQTSSSAVPDINKTDTDLQQPLQENHSSLTSSDLSKPANEVDAKISDTFLPQESSKDKIFTFTEECWVKIQDAAQQVLVEKTFQTGEQYTLPSGNGYILRTGNAGGIQISGPEMSPKILGKRGQVITNLSLDSEALSAYLNQR